MNAADALERAEAALLEGDLDAALADLLLVWADTRATELAELIEGVSDRATATLPAIPRGKTAKTNLAAWADVARLHKPSDIGRLLKDLDDLVRSKEVNSALVLLPRLDELLVFPPDPRIAAALVKYAGPMYHLSSGGDLKRYTRVIKGLGVHADPRVTEALSAIARSSHLSGTRQRDQFLKVVGVCRTIAKEPDEPLGLAKVRAALAKAPKTPKKSASEKKKRVSSDELLAEIYAHPDDDGARLVYADALSETGDPRGELIVLQLDRAAGRGTAATAQREAALLKQHGKAWLGALAGDIVLGETEWARGFPVATRTKMGKLYAAEASFTRREWATFERLHFGGAALFTDQMRALRSARGVTETALRRIGKLETTLPVREMEIVLELGVERGLPTIAAGLAKEKLPELRELTVETGWIRENSQVSELVELVASHGIERFVLRGGGLMVEVILPILAKGASGLQAVSWGDKDLPMILTALRDAKGRFSTLEITNPGTPKDVRAALEAIPAKHFATGRIVGSEEHSIEPLVRRIAEKVS